MIDSPIAKSATSAFFSSLPALGAELFGGRFIGITTLKDGSHAAVILLPLTAPKRLSWKAAMVWAEEAGGQLPTRPIAALLFANAKDQFEEDWYWTCEELGASYAWNQGFDYGGQDDGHKSYEGVARAVRTVPLTV